MAHDGLEGLARLPARRPDLIITDYMMPHLSGLEMIRQIAPIRITPVSLSSS